MSILALFLLGSLVTGVGLAVMLAFTRAVLYANVLTELDCAHEIQRRLRMRRRTEPVSRPAAGRERDERLEHVEEDSSPAAKSLRVHGTIQSAVPV